MLGWPKLWWFTMIFKHSQDMGKLRAKINFWYQLLWTTSEMSKIAKFWLSVSFFMSNILRIFPFFSMKNIIFRTQILLLTFFLKNSTFKHIYFLKWCPIFDNSEVVQSNWYQKNIGAELIYWIYCVFKIVMNRHDNGHPNSTRRPKYMSFIKKNFFWDGATNNILFIWFFTQKQPEQNLTWLYCIVLNL